jgi:hypothetical protein
MPELTGVSPDCTIHLEWRSLTACPPPAPKPATKDCSYVDAERGLKFKLGTLRKDGYGYFVSERKGYNYVTYMLNVCDHCGGCSDKNAAVCTQSMGKAVSFGRADKAFFLYRSVKLPPNRYGSNLGLGMGCLWISAARANLSFLKPTFYDLLFFLSDIRNLYFGSMNYRR